MMRAILIYFSKAKWMKRIVTHWSVARRVVLRFVAGESLEDALLAVKDLNKKGMTATLDQLGEDTLTPEEARQTKDQIISILDEIDKAKVMSSLSLKLTQIGLTLDLDLCSENLAEILAYADRLNIFVRIDMEDFGCLEPTLEIYSRMTRDKKFNNVGMVIQSYLYRSEDDVQDLLKTETKIRLVKGAYKESPEVAFPRKADVDLSFDRITLMLLEASGKISAPEATEDGKWPPIPAIATHDEARIEFAKEKAEELGISKQKLEFQMLYGIRRDLQDQLIREGYPVRIYVPYGTEWYPYFMRRLAERPANLWFFVSSLIRK